MKTLLTLAATTAALALAAPASAQLYQYTLTGVDGTGTAETASFTLNSARLPDYFSTGNGFVFYDVPGIYTYGATTHFINDLTFYNSSLDGGFFTGDYLVTTSGPQLYTGPESKPVLRTGTFTLTDYFTGGTLTLRVTPVAVGGAIPEPASWAMMILGFGMMGAAMRRRQRVTTRVSYALERS